MSIPQLQLEIKREVQRQHENNTVQPRKSVIQSNINSRNIPVIEISDSDNEEPAVKRAREENTENIVQQTFDDFSGNIPFELAPVCCTLFTFD